MFKVMPSQYTDLPILTPQEFDALVRIARSRSHRKSGKVVSDPSVAMARAVLFDGLTYRQAALASGRTQSGHARQATKALLRYMLSETRTHEDRPCVYSNLPNLTLKEFEALVAIVRSRGGTKKQMSDRSIAMARAVLLEGATYTEVGCAHDRPPSSVHQVVTAILQFPNRVVPVSGHTVSRQ